MKKITKFLDSVMGGIKRTCIAKALAVFAVASIAINANAQSNDLADVQTLALKQVLTRASIKTRLHQGIIWKLFTKEWRMTHSSADESFLFLHNTIAITNGLCKNKNRRR